MAEDPPAPEGLDVTLTAYEFNVQARAAIMAMGIDNVDELVDISSKGLKGLFMMKPTTRVSQQREYSDNEGQTSSVSRGTVDAPGPGGDDARGPEVEAQGDGTSSKRRCAADAGTRWVSAKPVVGRQSPLSTLPLAWMSLGRSRGPSPIPVSDDTDIVTVEPLSKGALSHILSMLPLGDWGLLTETKVDPVVWVFRMTYSYGG